MFVSTTEYSIALPSLIPGNFVNSAFQPEAFVRVCVIPSNALPSAYNWTVISLRSASLSPTHSFWTVTVLSPLTQNFNSLLFQKAGSVWGVVISSAVKVALLSTRMVVLGINVWYSTINSSSVAVLKTSLTSDKLTVNPFPSASNLTCFQKSHPEATTCPPFLKVKDGFK